MARRKKIEIVGVFAEGKRLYHPTPPGEPPDEVCGSYTKEGARGRWMRRVEATTGTYWGSLAALVEDINETAARIGLDDVNGELISINAEESGLNISGHRPATEEEIKWVVFAKERFERQKREQQEQAAARLKVERPDLFA